jgi:hypothetical protein
MKKKTSARITLRKTTIHNLQAIKGGIDVVAEPTISRKDTCLCAPSRVVKNCETK